MGGKSGDNAKVPKYLMSMHFGVASALDAVTKIWYGEKLAWEGYAANNFRTIIDKPNLFGGNKKEGGIRGNATFLMGRSTQVLPDELATILGAADGTECPGFRGFTSIFFHGYSYSKVINTVVDGVNTITLVPKSTGFNWATNNPYLRDVWVTGMRQPPAVDASVAPLPSDVDANPASIIYDCLTNTDWGMGASDAEIDMEAFTQAAQTLIDEEFAMSLMWTRAETLDKFIDDILAHINAVRFSDPSTGLISIKLIRDNYDPADLPIFTVNNARVTSFSRKLWGETTNEITVTWTNPKTEKEETVGMQDLGNIALQGAVITDSRNYHGVRNKDLAMRLAARDLRQAAAPLASCEIEIDRTGWTITAGDVIKVTWPEYNLDQTVMRVTSVDYGRPKDSKIRLALAEDIFSLEPSAFTSAPGSMWEDPSVPAEHCKGVCFSLPPYFAVRFLGIDVSTSVYPSAYVGLLVSPPNIDTYNYTLVAPVARPEGGYTDLRFGERSLCSYSTVYTALPAETVTENFQAKDSLLPASNSVWSTIVGEKPSVSDFVWIGTPAGANNDDRLFEIALITKVEPVGTDNPPNFTRFFLTRGVLDTVPKAWPVGTQIRFMKSTAFVYDTQEHSADADGVRYQCLGNTTLGQATQVYDLLDPNYTDAQIAVVGADAIFPRLHAPFRPANIKVGGDRMYQISSKNVSSDTNLVITWSRRNRLFEDTAILKWSDNDVTPESGQTTSVEIWSEDGTTLIDSMSGITGTSVTFPLATAKASVYTTARVEVYSARDGLRSLQNMSFRITGL